ncbi:hypothetical protein VP01_1604g2 [Puccinia sorghi]|uniref:Uncharacterized protein n=1 Tax=Puccinia sorghi TaxID=27349 RepID=A0A0L6VH82_9BASI|nr:hypothetical protein VP01_1604g2 [Puccinia sorghi]
MQSFPPLLGWCMWQYSTPTHILYPNKLLTLIILPNLRSIPDKHSPVVICPLFQSWLRPKKKSPSIGMSFVPILMKTYTFNTSHVLCSNPDQDMILQPTSCPSVPVPLYIDPILSHPSVLLLSRIPFWNCSVNGTEKWVLEDWKTLFPCAKHLFHNFPYGRNQEKSKGSSQKDIINVLKLQNKSREIKTWKKTTIYITKFTWNTRFDSGTNPLFLMYLAQVPFGPDDAYSCFLSLALANQLTLQPNILKSSVSHFHLSLFPDFIIWFQPHHHLLFCFHSSKSVLKDMISSNHLSSPSNLSILSPCSSSPIFQGYLPVSQFLTGWTSFLISFSTAWHYHKAHSMKPHEPLWIPVFNRSAACLHLFSKANSTQTPQKKSPSIPPSCQLKPHKSSVLHNCPRVETWLKPSHFQKALGRRGLKSGVYTHIRQSNTQFNCMSPGTVSQEASAWIGEAVAGLDHISDVFPMAFTPLLPSRLSIELGVESKTLLIALLNPYHHNGRRCDGSIWFQVSNVIKDQAHMGHMEPLASSGLYLDFDLSANQDSGLSHEMWPINFQYSVFKSWPTTTHGSAHRFQSSCSGKSEYMIQRLPISKHGSALWNYTSKNTSPFNIKGGPLSPPQNYSPIHGIPSIITNLPLPLRLIHSGVISIRHSIKSFHTFIKVHLHIDIYFS